MLRKNKTGFTLVELMVVISIISMLSSVVLSAVNKARQKANNTQTRSIVNEYRNAIELYRSNNPTGGLPNPDDNGDHCLGSYPTTHACGLHNISDPGFGLSTESPQLYAALINYMPSFPAAKQSDTYHPFLTSYYFNGPTYSCTFPTNPLGGVCTRATITWTNSNGDTNCLGGAVTSTGDSVIYCTITLE